MLERGIFMFGYGGFGYGGFGGAGWFALIVVLFILLIIVGAACFY
ncbi:YjcZ family sporulation protein [Bacillus sp. MUM 116]